MARLAASSPPPLSTPPLPTPPRQRRLAAPNGDDSALPAAPPMPGQARCRWDRSATAAQTAPKSSNPGRPPCRSGRRRRCFDVGGIEKASRDAAAAPASGLRGNDASTPPVGPVYCGRETRPSAAAAAITARDRPSSPPVRRTGSSPEERRPVRRRRRALIRCEFTPLGIGLRSAAALPAPTGANVA